ncbi:MAG: BrnT family toxin [Acidobacteriota bacterium]
MVVFEWDPSKSRINRRKHGISFDMSRRVFEDPDALSVHDRIEDGERRWRTLGMVGGVLLVLVAHSVRQEGDDEVIRVISARRADRKERRRYEEARQVRCTR